MEPELQKCDYDIVVVCAGTNNIPDSKQTPHEIAQEIINTAYACREHGVNDVLISLLTARRGYEEKVKKVNILLKYCCRAAHFYFIEHGNILIEHLYDGQHIDTNFLHIYANNISNCINGL